jgi:hypothetical protein
MAADNGQEIHTPQANNAAAAAKPLAAATRISRRFANLISWA